MGAAWPSAPLLGGFESRVGRNCSPNLNVVELVLFLYTCSAAWACGSLLGQPDASEQVMEPFVGAQCVELG